MKINHKIWSGTFTSLQYDNYVKGNIDIELPNPLILDKPLTLRAAISYTGIYRNGARVILSLQTDGNDGSSKQFNITFKGIIDTQDISFNCDSITESQIKGIYKTCNPNDNGDFMIQITDDTIFNDMPRVGTGDCNIL